MSFSGMVTTTTSAPCAAPARPCRGGAPFGNQGLDGLRIAGISDRNHMVAEGHEPSASSTNMSGSNDSDFS